uniref:Putative c2h2-type zn-finger protein n=1 Tax=Culex tarsalis TaxID=7177 RepID=A0A1Q3G0E0_CULTA
MNYELLRQNLDLSSVHSICRLCLSTEGKLEDLFFTDTGNRLVQRILECTSIQMAPANGIVSSICVRCRLLLEDLSKFRDQCLRCEEIFQSKLDSMETIEVVPDIFGLHSDEDEDEGQELLPEPEGDPDASGELVDSIKIEEDGWKDVEEELNVSAFKITTFDTKNGSSLQIDSDKQPAKNYTLTPPMDIDLKSLVVYIKDKKHWKCPHCDNKYFSQSGNLKAHINTHTGYKPYTCNLCNRSFAQKSNLNYHMKASHDPQRPFKCNACDRAFSTMDQMVLHLKTKHAQIETATPRQVADKKHFCPYCGKAFAQSFNLKLHVNTHTGERPYKCELCPKSFTQRSNLNVHINKSHGAKRERV